MDAEILRTSYVETAQADAAYFILASVWSYLNWMCPLADETNAAMRLVMELQRQPLLDCSAQGHILGMAYATKWRNLHD